MVLQCSKLVITQKHCSHHRITQNNVSYTAGILLFVCLFIFVFGFLLILQRKPRNRPKINFVNIRLRQSSLTYSVIWYGKKVWMPSVCMYVRVWVYMRACVCVCVCVCVRVCVCVNFWAHLPFWAFLENFSHFSFF